MQTIQKTLASYQSKMVQTCQQMLQTPSVNGVNDEIHLANLIADEAQKLSLYVQIIGDNPQRPNVIISTHPSGETGLLLIGHLDTVPAGDESQWLYLPFSGTEADGKLYGRGAVDTKGGMTSALYALAVLKEQNALTNGRAQLICVPDEESGATGTLGIKYLHEHGLLHGLGAIYAYSGDDIILGHRGLLRYRLTCHGEAMHTGFSDWQDGITGANAVTGMARLLLALEQLDLPYSSHKYFEGFRTMVTPGTVINGGVAINIVPDTCESLVDIRLTPESDLLTMDTYLERFIVDIITDYPKLNFEIDVLNYVPAAISDEIAPIFTVLESATEQVTRVKPKRAVAGPANEGYLLIERGIPTVCGFGPAGANAHAVNEYVEIQGLVDASVIFALTAIELDKLL